MPREVLIAQVSDFVQSDVVLSPAVREVLLRLSRAGTTERRLVERCRIVLGAADGLNDRQQAKGLGCDRQRVRRWRRRWMSRAGTVAEAEAAGSKGAALETLIAEVLTDDERAGAPPTFSAEQVARIVALACEKPEDSEIPTSHWTPGELARVAVERGIVPSISARQVGRYLAAAAIKPHRSRYWLTSPDKLANPEEYQENVRRVCDTYAAAEELEKNNTHVVSVDEKTGIQALERKNPTKPVQPGRVERREFEYIRHGTLTLIASFMVTSGMIGVPTVTEARGNREFVEHIEATVDLEPSAGWVFVADRLNTHMSGELVRVVAQRCGIDPDSLGEEAKGRGPLKRAS